MKPKRNELYWIKQVASFGPDCWRSSRDSGDYWSVSSENAEAFHWNETFSALDLRRLAQDEDLTVGAIFPDGRKLTYKPGWWNDLVLHFLT